MTVIAQNNIIGLTKKAEDADSVPLEDGLTAYVAVGKGSHNKTVKDLEEQSDPPDVAEDATITEKMRHRLKTKKGKARQAASASTRK